jgi:hypothetical protein
VPDVKSDVDVVDGKWHYLAMTCDGAVAKLFVDGKEVGSAKLEKKFSYPDVGPLTFGHIEGMETAKDGVIDEVRISRVLRGIEKTPEGPFANDADTVGLWHFDGEGKGGYADDSTTKNSVKVMKLESAKPQAASGNRWMEMDTGPFFTSTLVAPALKGNVAYKGVSVRLAKGKSPTVGEAGAAICFDTETLRVFAGWTDGYLKLPLSREGLSGPPDIAGKIAFSTPAGPGWAKGGNPEFPNFEDPRPDHLGPLPAEQAHYRGLYLSGDRVIFSYTIGEVEVLDSYDYEVDDGEAVFARTMEIAPAKELMTCRLAGRSGTAGYTTGRVAERPWQALLSNTDSLLAGVVGPRGVEVIRAGNSTGSTLLLSVPAHQQTIRVKTVLWSGAGKPFDRFEAILKAAPEPIALSPLTKGGPARWGAPLVTHGKLGDSSGGGAYVVDTLTAPEENPFKSFLRVGGHDFFKNGDMAICSVSGDVWIVSGIDEKLEKLTWRRFATGLHQPLGLRILNNEVYVLGRDQITRLHDLNHDGEADFYECFNNGCKVTTNGHGYATNLETDPVGNFYYTKCADNTPFGGTVVKVSKDGKYAEPFAVGLRNPNGLGISPSGFITEADNQGEWVPASRIDVVEGGKFLGYKPSAHDVPATDMGKPICFLPQNVDNSSGGQVWVTSDKWGPLKGEMLHTSYGAGRLLHVMMEKVNDTWQGGAVTFPLKFATGIMRGRFSPKDGQLYVCGLRGWQTAGVRSGAVQRVRYTGKTVYMPVGLHAHANGVAITFATPLDRASATDAGNYSVLRWTYKWTGEYPSRQYSVENPNKRGYDTVEIKGARLSQDGKTVFIEIPDIKPVKQQQIMMHLKAADGREVNWDLYQTIHNLGAAYEER